MHTFISFGLVSKPLRFLHFANWNRLQWNKASLPPLSKPPFFHTFQTGIYHNERRHPPPLYRSHRFLHFPNWNRLQWNNAPLPPLPKPSFFHVFETGIHPSKLKFMHPNERRYPSPSSEAIVFSRLPHWNAYRWKKVPLSPLQLCSFTMISI